MRILLVRHAEAVKARKEIGDGLRWLTPEGRSSMRRVVRKLRVLGVRYGRIVASPFVRTVQTAEILASLDGFEGSVEILADLAPEEARTVRIVTYLERLTDHETVVLVGHEPSIRRIAGDLSGIPRMAHFDCGACCLVHWSPGASGRLEWILDPQTLEPRASGSRSL